MKAVYIKKYGAPEDALEYTEEYQKPVPKAGELLIRVARSSLNVLDWRMMRANPFPMRMVSGLFRPGEKTRIPGADICGTVEAVGEGVTNLAVGDEVFGEAPGMQTGGCAEYTCAAATSFAKKLPNVSFEQVVCIPVAGCTALQLLRNHAAVKEGQKVLIVGASGGVGQFAVQIAKHLGARVTAVCSGRNAELVQSIGADEVIDYTKEDWAKQGKQGKQYDLILDNIVDHAFQDCENCIGENGVYMTNSSSNTGMMIKCSIWSNRPGNRKMMAGPIQVPNTDDYVYLQELIGSGKMRSVIAKRYPLKELVEAMKFLEGGHSPGKIVIEVDAAVE